MDKVAGFLEVGANDQGEVVINHPDLQPDENGVGHIVFSPEQARSLARLLSKYATEIEAGVLGEAAEERRRRAGEIPVDRTARCLTDGSPVTEDHRELGADGQQKGYVVLTTAERAKGFVRPVRRSYIHRACGSVTTMGLALAETYARDPGFYSGTFCCRCAAHFPLDQFRWEGTDEQLGS